MGERILVTGATGFIGKRLVEYLLVRGFRVRIFLRPESARESGFGGRVEEFRGSYTDSEAIGRAVRDMDRVVHLAGVTKAADEKEFWEGNVVPVIRLLAALGEYNPGMKRLLLVSSLAACGPSCEGVTGIREEDAAHPVSAYGRSKLEAEILCMEASRDIPVTIVRPSAVYGPGDRDILQVFQMMQRGVLLTAGNARRQRFSMVYVDDLVQGIVAAASADASCGKRYFITSPEACSWDSLILAAKPVLGFRRLFRVALPGPLVYILGSVLEIAGTLAGKAALINRDKANELLQDFWVCSPEKAAEELGFTARTSLAEGIEKTIAWYRQKGWM
ncbi:MAG: NAD-dependent epimerase/dehydratase family protein [Chlorobium sp.]|jgi:nucleoside-diphosphate-sugar epimerase|nr:NAD-dependent epimerase/dehydratase family protein [Chlorobium sp.]